MLRRRAFPTLALSIALLLTGCFKHTYTVGAGAPRSSMIYKHWHHHWLFGLIGDQAIELAALCPSGNATIHEETTFLNGLIDALIGVIYSPTTVTVRCDDGRQTSTELSAADVERIVHDSRFLDWVAASAPERLADSRAAVRSGRIGDDAVARSASDEGLDGVQAGR